MLFQVTLITVFCLFSYCLWNYCRTLDHLGTTTATYIHGVVLEKDCEKEHRFFDLTLKTTHTKYYVCFNYKFEIPSCFPTGEKIDNFGQLVTGNIYFGQFNSRDTWSDRLSAENYLQQMIGHKATIYYNNDDPTQNSFSRYTANSSNLFGIFISGSALIVVSLLHMTSDAMSLF